ADVGRAVLAGNAHSMSAQVSHALDGRVHWDDQPHRIFGVDLGDIDQGLPLGARLKDLVAAGKDCVFLPGDYGAELRLIEAVMPQRHVEGGRSVVAKLPGDVERRELYVGDEGEPQSEMVSGLGGARAAAGGKKDERQGEERDACHAWHSMRPEGRGRACRACRAQEHHMSYAASR